jgi:hypothetical protein
LQRFNDGEKDDPSGVSITNAVKNTGTPEIAKIVKSTIEIAIGSAFGN